MFDLRLADIADWVRSKKFRSVAIQLPEGLKPRATEVADIIMNEGASAVILGDPCYGACDVKINFKDIADGLVHIGHSPIPSMGQSDDILFVEASAHIDIKEGTEKIAHLLPDNIGLLSTVQYISALQDVKEVLERSGKKVYIGSADGRMKYPGQVLGCNCSAASSVADRVDCFLYIGEGMFHPLAAAFGVGKEIKAFNPLTCELQSMNETRDRVLRKRFAMTENSKDADIFAVIVSSKPGQRRDAVADDIIEKISKAGKKAYKVMMEEIRPDALLAYKADAYVCTACPRLVMDDSPQYARPMLTPPEAEIALGLRRWEDYIFDSF